jgi:hypothetical protein
MFGSMVLEVAIGIIFVYLLLSLIVTAITELISGWRKWRAQNLRAGIRNLLDSGAAEEWVTTLYQHPLIQSLSPSDKPGKASHGPSYIPSRTFAVALIETLQAREPAGRPALKAVGRIVDAAPDTASLGDLQADIRAAVKDLPDSGAVGDLKRELLTLIDRLPPAVSLAEAKTAVRSWLARVPDRWLQMLIENLPPDSYLKRSLTALLEESHLGVEHFKENLEVWFNNAMERVSGWYKRKTQAVHLLLAFLVTLVINVDSVLVVNALSQNQALRQSVVAQAEAYAQEAAKTPAPGSAQTPAPGTDAPGTIQRLQDQLAQLDLPIGWTLPGQRGFDPANRDYRGWPGWRMYGTWSGWLMLWIQTIRFHLLGWLLTAFAISLGAPFWFDMLNKVINIRSAGRAPEEKPKTPQVVPQPVEPGQTPAVPS